MGSVLDDLNPFTSKGSLLDLPKDDINLVKGAYNNVVGAVTPTKPDISASTAANGRAQALGADLNNQRNGYQPQNAPQIGTPPPPAAYGASPKTPYPGTSPGSGTVDNNFWTNSSPSNPAPLSAYQPAPPPASVSSIQAPNQDRQQGALDMLQGAAMGTTPSAAQIQTNQNMGTEMANQYALASSLQGRHPGAAFESAARGAATVQGQTAGQGALLRATEQAQARDAYGNLVGGARGQDIQTDVANLNAKLTTMGYDTQTKNALLSAQLQAMGYDAQTADAVIAAQAQAAASANAYKGAVIGGAAGGLAHLA